ncbi:unnamed protein product [Dibothriocephalus latus]|uniref:Tetraspanin n=1 Tax=Dibothriocephalus latus TaxID=60516 RepID=A0A3P7RG20_DIBLA|nr:unnamed protein product [Dibothriocephalus latus]
MAAAAAAASGGKGATCAACKQGCCSTLGWMRPFGLLLALIIIGELVAVFLTLGFESRALNPISGIHSQMQSMFVEAKTDLSSQLQDPEPATACWDTLERDFQCCGATGYMEWLVDHSPTQLPSLANSSTGESTVHCLLFPYRRSN